MNRMETGTSRKIKVGRSGGSDAARWIDILEYLGIGIRV